MYARVFFLKSTPYNMWVMRVCIYSVGKDLVKQTWQISQTECFTSISQEGFTRETLVKTPCYHDSSHSSHVLYTWLLRRLASREIHMYFVLSLSLHTFSYSTLTIKNPPHKYRAKWLNKITIKFGTELKLTQNSCKSQLYNCYL